MLKTAMPARLPDFLGIGTQKGGTTSLHQWLSANPHIYLPSDKEIHYFDLKYNYKDRWYKDNFKNSDAKQICGEITPYYLFHPEAAERIFKTIPSVKMLVLLRDPAERAISQYIHSRARGFEWLEPAEAIAAESKRIKSGSKYSLQKHSYLSRSKYIIQLERFEKLFKKDQMMIIKSEDMFKKPRIYMELIEKFLGVKKLDLEIDIPHANKRKEKNSSGIEEARDILREKLLTTALEVQKRYGFGWDWSDK